MNIKGNILAYSLLVCGFCACNRTTHVSPWASNAVKLSSLGRALELYKIEHRSAPASLFEISGYGDQMRFVDPDSKRAYDWLFFPEGIVVGDGEIIYALSPTVFNYGDGEKRIVLLKDGVVEFYPLSRLQITRKASAK